MAFLDIIRDSNTLSSPAQKMLEILKDIGGYFGGTRDLKFFSEETLYNIVGEEKKENRLKMEKKLWSIVEYEVEKSKYDVKLLPKYLLVNGIIHNNNWKLLSKDDLEKWYNGVVNDYHKEVIEILDKSNTKIEYIKEKQDDIFKELVCKGYDVYGNYNDFIRDLISDKEFKRVSHF